MPTDFCDSDRLIYICYIGGAYGYALRRLLLFGPDTDGFDPIETEIRADGAAHEMLGRSGLKRDANDFLTQLNLNMMPEEIGLPDTDPWWDLDVDAGLLDHARRLINKSVTFDNQPASGCHDRGRWIWVDHIPPRAARALFPRAKIMMVRRDWKTTFRDFAIKNIFQPTDANAIQHGRSRGLSCSLDARLLDAGLDLTRTNYKQVLRGSCDWAKWCHDKLESDDYRCDAFVVNADRLFSTDGWQSEYDAILTHCGLHPMHEQVQEFVSRYNKVQPRRGAWTPNLDWTWVKVGPNQHGRW